MTVLDLILLLEQCDRSKKIAVSDINGDGIFGIADIETYSDTIVICPDYQEPMA